MPSKSFLFHTLSLHVNLSSYFLHRPLEKMLDLTLHINKHPTNKDLLGLSGIVQVLDLAKKMNKKNASITGKVDAILAQF